MVIVGVIIGLLLGSAFGSVYVAIALGILGGFAARALFGGKAKPSRTVEDDWRKQGMPDRPAPGLAALQSEIAALKTRLETVEKSLGITPSTTAPTSTVHSAEATAKPQEQANTAATASPSATTPRVTPSDANPPNWYLPGQLKPRAAAMSNAASSKTEVAPSAAVLPAAPKPTPTPTPQATVEPNTALQTKSDPKPPRVAEEPSRLAQLLKQWIFGGNPLVKIGVLILFLGLGFLLRYVAENTVFPVELRYAGVAAMGVGLLLMGWRRRERKDGYGLILQGTGIGIMYLTTLAAMRLHPLIPPSLGLVILVFVAAFAALLSILQNSLALAVAGTLFGFFAPVLASTGSANHVAFFSYLALLNLGIVAIAWFKAWRLLNLIGFVCTVFLGAAWGAKYWQPELLPSVEPFLLLFFVLYLAVTFLFARRTLLQATPSSSTNFDEHVRHSMPLISYVDGSLVFGVPTTAFGMQYLLIHHLPYGPAFSALGFGLTYIVIAFALFRNTGLRYALLNETMIALAVIFGSLAIPLGLEQQWTAAAWAVEAAGMYWVGMRQQRTYARLFAALLLAGSAIYFALGLRLVFADPVIEGSVIGCVLLAAAFWWIYRLQRSATPATLSAIEQQSRAWVVALGSFFVALIPFLVLDLQWSATALAVLAAVAVFAAQRLQDRSLLLWGCSYQGLAGVLFLMSLRGAEEGAVLANGWAGLISACLIGASALVGVWAVTFRRTGADGKERTEQPAFSVAASGGLLAGLAFINLAPLFVLPLQSVVYIWPLSGIATLWIALRMRHLGGVGFALGLEAIAGLAHLNARGDLFDAAPAVLDATPFLHGGFLAPVLISVAALYSARMLMRRSPAPDEKLLGWIALAWSGVWWGFAWTAETVRVLPEQVAGPGLVGLAIGTCWLWSVVARRLQWKELGQATLVYVPVLIVLAASNYLTSMPHPLAGWGLLAWPLALGMHLWLLRRQTAWAASTAITLVHTVGAWLFLLLATLEASWWFAQLTSPDTAWPLLGVALVPALYLWALTRPRLQRLWPLSAYPAAYAIFSALPIVLYILGWFWFVNVTSSGNPAPLPYIPLVNPLELGQMAVLVCVGIWWLPIRKEVPSLDDFSLLATVISLSLFALITASVARTCHFWGGVPWNLDALLGSALFQTSISIVWSVIAIGFMILGNLKAQRTAWIAGATVVGIVVVKLFLVELDSSGSLTRIVSFIVVGLLLLLVGYFAPLPPKSKLASTST